MNAIHVISTAPFFAKNPQGEYRAEDFDLYCMALSALCWRRYNGDITLCCDKTAAEYYRSIGLTELWNEIDECVPDDLDGINPTMFWAGGKLLALRRRTAPVVMLDTDFIVWRPLPLGNEIVAAHREELSSDIYPPLGYFRTRGHILPYFSETVPALNTAFLYIPNGDFLDFYTSQAIAFMKSAEDCDDYLCYMVFAEQRLAAMCAQFTDTPVRTLLDKELLFFPQDCFTHLWGAKQAMRDNPDLRADFVGRCRRRIRSDFPEYGGIADKIDRAAAE